MRWLLAFLLLGCEAPAEDHTCTPPARQCGMQCGNGALDGCYVRPDPAVCEYVPMMEPCDGIAVARTCAQLGYYGGKARCTETCTLDETPCEACAPGIPCATFAPRPVAQLVVSGSQILVAGEAAPAPILDIAWREVAQLPFVVEAAAATDDGWLVVSGGKLYGVARTGEVAAPITLPTTAPVQIAAGFDRALLLWSEPDASPMPDQLVMMIVDTHGDVTLPPTELALAHAGRYRMTSSGGAFYVAGGGRMYVIDAGTGQVVPGNGFPTSQEIAALTWAGGTGWYVTDGPHALQRFDFSGNVVGTSMYLGQERLDAFASYREHLLALRAKEAKLELVRIEASGTIVVVREIGITDTGAKQLSLMADDVIVGWPKAGMRIARAPAE